MCTPVSCAALPSLASQQILCSCLLCVIPPETWRGRGRSESLPRTPCHIWCTHRREVSSAGGLGARCGAEQGPPRERSGCRGPDLTEVPSDTEGHTWGVQGSQQGSECHKASPPPSLVFGQHCPGPANILPTKHTKLMQQVQRMLSISVIHRKPLMKKGFPLSQFVISSRQKWFHKPFCLSILSMSSRGTATYWSLLHAWTNRAVISRKCQKQLFKIACSFVLWDIFDQELFLFQQAICHIY